LGEIPEMKEELAINHGLLHDLFFKCLFPIISESELDTLHSESTDGSKL